MANQQVKNNVEVLLMESIDEYLSCDPFGLYSANYEEAAKVFSQAEIEQLEKKLTFIEGDLLNLIFLTDEILPLVENESYILNITGSIKIVKENDVYKFFKVDEDENEITFDVVHPNSYNYFNFDFELSRFFSKIETEKSSQKILKKLHKKN